MSTTTVEGLTLKVGELENEIQQALEQARQDKLVQRIWALDHTLWKIQPTEITNRLGWLDVAERMRSEIGDVQRFAQAARDDGIRKVLLLGMGGSSLAPELFGKVFGSHDGLQFTVLDSTDPDAVRAAQGSHDPATTLYIVSSKSGGTVETASLFKYFYNQALAKLGGKVGEHFVAITDPGSGLAKTGEQLGFRHVFLADPNIGGRYSALSHFGLVPAAFVGVDLERLLSSAAATAAHCRRPVDENPAALLGLVLGVCATHGRDKVTFALPTEYASFGDWVEQLVAESTGKEGKGILPVSGEPALDAYGNDRVFVRATSQEDRHPSIALELNDKYDLGGQFFLWEFATAVAGYVLGINPFDQPNVESAKVQTRQVVDIYQKTGSLPKPETTPLDSGSLAAFLQKVKEGDYIAIQAYVAPSAALAAALQDLRKRVGNKYRVATTLGYGPRFLHSTGQLHKGDKGNGLFIQFITSPPANDVPIPKEVGTPDSDITFGVLKVAQAMGDAQALRSAGRRVVTFEASDDLKPHIQALTAGMQ